MVKPFKSYIAIDNYIDLDETEIGVLSLKGVPVIPYYLISNHKHKEYIEYRVRVFNKHSFSLFVEENIKFYAL